MRQYEMKAHEGVTYRVEKDVVQAVIPAESHFGFSYWALMIPPVKPKDILMLGCGTHTIPILIDRVWGQGRGLTCSEDKDAFDFVKTLKGQTFDYIIVDLFEGPHVPPAIYSKDFLQDLSELSTGLVAINSDGSMDGSPYQTWFGKVLEKKLNNNVVTFLERHGYQKQYFIPRP